MCDFFVIATGTSDVQVKAIADAIKNGEIQLVARGTTDAIDVSHIAKRFGGGAGGGSPSGPTGGCQPGLCWAHLEVRA